MTVPFTDATPPRHPLLGGAAAPPTLLKHTMNIKPQILAALALLIGSSCASAQVLIDQGAVLAGGITAGDGPGFPVTLSQPGSYKLSGNLDVPFGVNGFEITAEGVTLDLNGFRLSGPGKCTRDASSYAMSCVGSNHNGIGASGNATLTLRNGTVQGFAYGVVMGRGVAEQLQLRHNRYGLWAGSPGRYTGLLVEYNQHGMSPAGGMLEHSVFSMNEAGVSNSSVQMNVSESHFSGHKLAINGHYTRAVFLYNNKSNGNTYAY